MPPSRPEERGAPELSAGALLGGRYRLSRMLARGGMARLYTAEDERLSRPVAVKVLSPPFADDPDFVRRFLAEARTAASLSHPHLAHVYDSGSDAERHYIVMELLEDHESLVDLLARRGTLAPAEAVRIATDVLAALDQLHGRGLVHCDVKSGNVMVGPRGAKLIDFGIARPMGDRRRRPTSIGSLHTMSPEQLRGEPLTPASDLFAVGVVLFQALTGRVPFPGDDPDQLAAAHAAGPVADPAHLAPSVSPRLSGAVLQALTLDPARRFANAGAMSRALAGASRVDADETTTVVRTVRRPPSHPPRQPPPQPPRRPNGVPLRRLLVSAAAAAALLVAAVTGANLLVGPTGEQPPSSAAVSASPAPSAPPGTVLVPNTIGMSEDEAQSAAAALGLNWRIAWREVAGQTPGVYDQEPAPGTPVEPGSRFVMYAYRSP